jgi:hypothetical protein
MECACYFDVLLQVLNPRLSEVPNMSIGPTSAITASVAGAPLAQTHGAHAARASHDVSAQQLQIQSNQRAETAEGVGATDGEDNQTSDRDADGRRLWEVTAKARRNAAQEEAPPTLSKDATGEAGHALDLSG